MNLPVAAVHKGLGVSIDQDEFAGLVDPLLPGLRLHCYRLVGSLDDAEDMTQEALVRAWRKRARLADAAGLRPWLYRIATNACLDLLAQRRRRPTTPLAEELGWPDPVPDAWLVERSGTDPADVLLRREHVSLAFLTAVQTLAPRQRAMLVLRDVLEWTAADVATALDTTVAAVYSGVQRARASVRERSRLEDGVTPTHGMKRGISDVADRYLAAWERADTAALAGLLAADARLAMPPDPRRFNGRTAVLAFLASVLGQPPGHRIRLRRTSANREPAFLVLQPEPATGALRPIGLKVLLTRGQEIVEIRGPRRRDSWAGAPDPPCRDASCMFSPDRHMAVEFDLRAARRRAAEYLPFSPAWDAAVARVEDLEREVSRLEYVTTEPSLSGRTMPRWASSETNGSSRLAEPRSVTA